MKKKIIVIGSPGSGKSYFSKRLHELTGIPLYHIDNLYWHADRTHITREELRERFVEIMKQPEWIIDGNYISTMEQRIQGCETIFYLDFSTKQCIEGIKSRVGKKRDDIPWVEEMLDEEFLQFVERFEQETKPLVEELLERYREKEMIRFGTRAETRFFVQKLKEK